MATILSLQDNFNDNSLDTSKWTSWSGSGASVSETNSQIECTVAATTNGSNSEIYSATTYNITDKFLYVNLYQAAGSYVDSYFTVKTASEDRAGFIYDAGSINSYRSIGGVDDYGNSASVTPGSSLWLRIRVDGSTFYWDYSTNNQVSWTELDSAAVSSLFSMTAVTVELGVYKWSATSTSQTKTIFDTFNSFDLLVSVNDSVGITENVDRLISGYVSVFDSLTLTENVSRGGLLSALVFDSIGITEDNAIVITQLYVYVSVSDGILIEEYITGQIESILYIDLSQDQNTVYVY